MKKNKKQTLSWDLSHNIKTNAVNIIGYSKLLLNKGKLDSTQREQISMILSEAENLMETLNKFTI